MRSEQRHAAIDAQIDPGNEAAGISGKEKCRLGELSGLAQSAQWDGTCHLGGKCVAFLQRDPQFFKYCSLGWAWAQHVDANLAFTEFESPAFRKGTNRCLGSGIDGM